MPKSIAPLSEALIRTAKRKDKDYKLYDGAGLALLIYAYELITKKAPSERVLTSMTTAGWLLLLSLMALSIFNDIYRLTNGN